MGCRLTKLTGGLLEFMGRAKIWKLRLELNWCAWVKSLIHLQNTGIYIILYYIILYYIMLCYVMIFYIMFCYIILCDVMFCFIILYYVILYCIILYDIIFYYIIFCYIILYCIILYYIILYYIHCMYMWRYPLNHAQSSDQWGPFSGLKEIGEVLRLAGARWFRRKWAREEMTGWSLVEVSWTWSLKLDI